MMTQDMIRETHIFWRNLPLEREMEGGELDHTALEMR